MALYHSTFRRFDALSCKTTPEVQLTTVSSILVAACRTLYCRCSASRHTMVSCRITKRFPTNLHRLYFTSHKRQKTSETRMHYTIVHFVLFILLLSVLSLYQNQIHNSFLESFCIYHTPAQLLILLLMQKSFLCLLVLESLINPKIGVKN